MSASETAARLRELAAQHDTLGELEDTYEAALAAYREDKSEGNKEAYQAAAIALREARNGIRASDVLVASNEPGSVTIGAAGVGASVPKADPTVTVEEV